jgi:hypothetical protein
MKEIKVKIDGLDLDFTAAEEISKVIADKVGVEMLIAWYDPAKGTHFPNVQCCGSDEPSWLIYAKNRGGKVLVNVNGFQFIYL